MALFSLTPSSTWNGLVNNSNPYHHTMASLLLSFSHRHVWIDKLHPLVWFGLVSLFNGISTLFRLFNAKAILLEEQWYYSTHSWEGEGVHTFPKVICLKVNVITRLECELTYNNSAVHRFNHYTTRTALHSLAHPSGTSYVTWDCFIKTTLENSVVMYFLAQFWYFKIFVERQLSRIFFLKIPIIPI